MVFSGGFPLKDRPVFATGGGVKTTDFFLDSKYKISGLECRRRFKLVLAHTMDPSGPFWGAHPAEKYLHTRRHTLEKFRRKSVVFVTQAGWSAPGGVKHKNCTKPANPPQFCSETDL